MLELIPIEIIEKRIFLLRGHKIMLDRDLAELYGVSTKRLNEQVKRNQGRFPKDFMFKLSKNEADELVAICDRFNTMKHSTVDRRQSLFLFPLPQIRMLPIFSKLPLRLFEFLFTVSGCFFQRLQHH